MVSYKIARSIVFWTNSYLFLFFVFFCFSKDLYFKQHDFYKHTKILDQASVLKSSENSNRKHIFVLIPIICLYFRRTWYMKGYPYYYPSRHPIVTLSYGSLLSHSRFKECRFGAWSIS